MKNSYNLLNKNECNLLKCKKAQVEGEFPNWILWLIFFIIALLALGYITIRIFKIV